MNKDIFNIKGKIIIITGGLGQLGRQYCYELLQREAKVVILDLPQTPPEEFFQNCETIHKDNVLYFSSNITQKDSIKNTLKQVKEKWGVPHGLINNAALDSPPDAPAEENGPFENYPEKSWDEVMDVNVKSVMLTCQVIGGTMAENGRGSIINICSTYGLVSPNQNIYEYRKNETGKPFYKPVAYSASKSALLNLTRYLATYWALSGVRVNTLTLGGVFNDQDNRFLEEYKKRVPLERMADENEYNGAIVFLISDASSYMTGSNLIIDGGWTAW